MQTDLSSSPDRHTGPPLPRRDRLAVLISLAALTTLSWIYLLRLDASMASMDMTDMAGMPCMHMDMPGRDPRGLLLGFVMWSVMMVGMMLPGAAPMILLFAAVQRRARPHPFPVIVVFVFGYVAVWTVFSAGAAGLQAGLQSLRMLTADRLASGTLAGAVLVAAGLYQWTALKERCLAHCQSPLAFMTRHWRPGTAGALRMGVMHGAYCLGCCWALMVLLFVGGVMNLLWVAALAALVLLEKILPGGRLFARIAGIVLIAWGAALLTGVSGPA